MTESPEHTSRRGFLSRTAAIGAASVASVGGLAGCLGGDGTDGQAGGDDGGNGGTPTPSGLRVDTLDVGGSPGEPMAVRPPGEVALLDFFATWCAPCKPQMAELGTVREEFPELHMLSLTNELELDPEKIAEFWREYDGTWPVAKDEGLEVSQTYGVNRIPTLIVLDASGTEVWRHSGLSAAEDIVEKVREARA